MYVMAQQKVRRQYAFYATPEALCFNEQERCEGVRGVKRGNQSIGLIQLQNA